MYLDNTFFIVYTIGLQEQKDFFESVRASYLSMAEQFDQRYRVVDASQSLSDVQQALSAILQEMLETAAEASLVGNNFDRQ